MEPEDLYRIDYPDDAQVSPDGRRIAFVQTRLNAETDDYRSNIWIVPAAGGEPARFTAGEKHDTSPRWSPDGRWLAFLSNRSSGGEQKKNKKEKNQIWLLPSDGGEARRLTKLPGGAAEIVWSPDSLRIACTSRVPGPDEPPEDDADNTSPNTARARIITNLKYKLNGEGFVYDRRPHVFVVVADDGTAQQITDGDYDDHAPAWSSDGQTIAFASARHAEREFDNVSDIFVVPATGGEIRRVTAGRGPSHNPAFSPDGSTIAYYGHTDPQAGFARNTLLWTAPIEGGEPNELIGALDRAVAEDRPPIWSRDGTTIYFGLGDRGAAGIHAVPASGGTSRPIVSGRRLVSAWSLAADGSSLSFVASEPTNPGDVYTVAADGSGERRLTNINAAWLRDAGLSDPEEFTYTSTDGWTVQGWLMKPAGFVERRRYPLLLNVHGGPHAAYGWGFFDEFQVQAGAGYAVLYTNPRGSQTYGEEFAYACTGDWGGKDYEDVMNGLDAALARASFVDSDRIGVLGGSYGGFMTSWIVGHTQRFKAAVSERAVNAMYSMFGSSDIGFYFQQFELGGTPQQALDKYLERSPVTYAAQIATPLLILHSENDLRCPMEQAEQLYVTLKTLRKTDVVFVRFPEETHELSRSGKPSRRVERFQIILDWFDHYLQPDAAGQPRAERLAAAIARERERR